MYNLNKLLNQYAIDPENPDRNFELALAYEDIGQTAAAISFFLRAAERTNDDNLSYECLCKIGLCFDRQGRRANSVRGAFKHAICLLPSRPEAYFLLSRFYERTQDHVSAYMYAELGLQLANFNQVPLRSSVEYPGKYGLIFEKSVASWWWGKPAECRQLLMTLKNEYAHVMDESHRRATLGNLTRLGCGPLSQAFLPYDQSQCDKLRYKFDGADTISRNYSQVYQDIFVLSMLNGKRDGVYLEVGAGGSHLGSNTALLEEFGWTGIGIELNESLVEEHKNNRKNPVLIQDATTTDYKELLRKIAHNGVIDYLQLDCEPSETTYKILTMIPFEEFRFAVITYEHDHYVDITNQYRQLSRDFLKSKGYVMVANDISPDGVSTFEDWWVRPELISPSILNAMIHITSGPQKASDYICSPAAECAETIRVNNIKAQFPYESIDMGDNSEVFKRWIYDEVIVNQMYEKFHSVQKGDVVVDIGCNVGTFPVTIRDRSPSHIYCVEPSPSLIPAIRNNTANADFPVTILNYGISNVSGSKEITKTDHLYGTPGTSFQSKTFKDFLLENNITHIDFFKLDCEGGEYDIFNSENHEFLSKHVGYVAGEWHLSGRDNGIEEFMEFRNLYLTGNNFRVFEPYVWKEVTHLIHSDQYLRDFYNWWNPIDGGSAQFMIYIDNRERGR